MRRLKIHLTLITLMLCAGAVKAERIKDLADVRGVRSNQLVGYGLVVGLEGTGDNAAFTNQSLRSMLQRLGVNLPPGVVPKSKNVAAVAVHASLPAFSKAGQQIDVTVSALGSAKSLRGGSLLMTPLKGADGQVYAVAQGNLVVGGFSATGADGSTITQGIPTVARIPGGASVEREVATPFGEGASLELSLHSQDFTTLERMVQAINSNFGPGTARAQDSASLRVSVPLDPSRRVTFVSLLENLELEPAQAAARVIVNSRTGTVVIGQQVRVDTAAVTHGTLSVTISEQTQVSQPGPLSAGTTEQVPQSDIEVRQGSGRMVLFEPGVRLSDLVNAINRVGAAPQDLVAILQALHEAGALRAQLVVI